jgi:hypothetical protein
MVWVDMALLLQKCPAINKCAIFLPQRKMKNEAVKACGCGDAGERPLLMGAKG